MAPSFGFQLGKLHILRRNDNDLIVHDGFKIRYMMQKSHEVHRISISIPFMLDIGFYGIGQIDLIDIYQGNTFDLGVTYGDAGIAAFDVVQKVIVIPKADLSKMSFLKVRQMTKHIKGNLSDEIISERNER